MSRAAFDKWVRESWGAYPRYAAQLSCYMHATGLGGLMAVKNRDSGLLHTMEVNTAPVPLAAIKLKVARIEAAAAERKLTLECDQFCMCQFGYLGRFWGGIIARGPLSALSYYPAH